MASKQSIKEVNEKIDEWVEENISKPRRERRKNLNNSTTTKGENMAKVLENKSNDVLNLIMDFAREKKKILENDQYADEYKEEQIQEKAKEYEEKINETKSDLLQSFNNELESTSVGNSLEDEDISKLTYAQNVVQEKIRGVEDPDKLDEIYSEIAESNQDKSFKKAGYDLISSRIEGLGGDATRVKQTYQNNVLSENEKAELKRHEKLEKSSSLVEGFANSATKSFEDLQEAGDVDPDSVKKNLSSMVKPRMDKVVNRLNET